MSSSNVYAVSCGIIFGIFIVLLTNKKVRANVTRRSTWLTANPRGYIGLLVICAAVVLSIGYLLAVRFA